MITHISDIQYSQRSFTNACLGKNNAGIPSGLILDIGVTTPAKDEVYISQLIIKNSTIYMALAQRDQTIATISTKTLNNPVRLTSQVTGVCAIVIFGSSPDNYYFEQDPENWNNPDVCIHPALVTFYDAEAVSSASSSDYTLEVTNVRVVQSISGVAEFAETVEVAISSDVEIAIGGGLLPSIVESSNGDKTMNLQLSASMPSAYNSGYINEYIESDGFIRSVNGITPSYGNRSINIQIAYDGKPVEVKSTPSGVIIEVPGLKPCDGYDIIDEYIGPQIPRRGEVWILDNIYENAEDDAGQPKRNMENLEGSTYGYEENLELRELDPVYDVVPPQEEPLV